MNTSYDLHPWRTQYLQERLVKANRRHLVEQARAGREPRESGWLGLVWSNPLALLRGALFSVYLIVKKDAK
jgi:hypothetical protein